MDGWSCAMHMLLTSLAISAYMPQPHTKVKDKIYTEILTWIHAEITTKYPTVTTLMGGDLQATP
jgi:hypothetical protein